MPTITSSYPPGGSLTSGRNFGPDMSGALAALIQDERARRAAPPVAEEPTFRRPVRAQAAPPVRSGPSEGNSRLKAALENAEIEEARARIAAARALSEPAPMKSIRGGPGIVGGVGRSGLQLDTSGMTGAQRRALLPQSAAMGAIGDSGASLAASTLQAPAPDQSNPHGFAYANPIDQSRAFQALLRSNTRGQLPIYGAAK